MQITSTDSGLQLIFLNSFGRFGNGISVFPTLRMLRSWSKFNGRLKSCKQFTIHAKWVFHSRFDFGSVFLKKTAVWIRIIWKHDSEFRHMLLKFLPNSAQCGIIMLLLSVCPIYNAEIILSLLI